MEFNYLEALSQCEHYYAACKKGEITKEQIENIKNYGDTIQTLDTFVKAVRKLPGMYIGAIGNPGWRACIREIFQNAIDEMVKVESPCHYIKVTFFEATQQCIIEDTGRGIPHGQIIHIFSSAHSSSNYTKKLGQYSSGVHGVGSGVALSLSRDFNVKSYVLGKAKEVQFVDGIPWEEGEKDIPCPEGRQGTTIFMSPATAVLGDLNLTCDDIFALVFNTLLLTNIGDRIDFIAYGKDGKKSIEEELVNTDGIITDLIRRVQTPLVTPIHFNMDNGTMKAEIAFTIDSSDITSAEQITSFSNFTLTLGGKHVDGFTRAVCNFFTRHMNKFYLGEKSKITVIGNDIKSGLKAIIVAAHLNPIFIGQSKAILSNEDMDKFVYDLTMTSLDEWSKVNTNDLTRICKYFKEVAEIRMKSDDNKVNLSKKYTANVLTKLPSQYVEPSERKGEFIIVEGKSAYGGAKNNRDNSCQGILPIRGKLPNAFEKTQADFLNNEEVAAIITIIGGGYGKNFDIDKVEWEKIIICTDGDIDGNHIRTLLTRFFLIYMPDLVKQGRVYAAIPPLYGITSGRQKKYFTSKVEISKYVQGIFSKKHSIADEFGTGLTQKELTAFFARNIDYVREINIIRDTFAVNPYLLEYVLSEYNEFIDVDIDAERLNSPVDITASYMNYINSDDKNKKKAPGESFLPLIMDNPLHKRFQYSISNKFNFKKFKTLIEKRFRFIKVTMNEFGVININGLVDSKSQTIVLNDRFISACSNIIRILNTNESYVYRLDNVVTSLYDIMLAFDKIAPDISRYKGLGEQLPEELGETVIRPDGIRTLIKFNFEDIKQEIDMIRYIDSNKGILLKNVKVTRQDLE